MPPRVLLTLDPQQVRTAPKYRNVVKRDWQRARGFLEGKFPQPLPEVISWGSWVNYVNGAVKLKQFLDAPFIVVDTEYQYDETKNRPWDRVTKLELIGIYGPGTPVLQIELPYLSENEMANVSKWLRNLVANQTVVFQNTSADVVALDKFQGIKWEDYYETHDTMYAHAVLWAELPHSLEFLASIYGRHEKLKHLAQRDPLLYNAGDVLETSNAWEALAKELQEDPRSHSVYTDLILPLRPIIMESEDRGIRIHKSFVAEAKEILEAQTQFASEVAEAYAGFPVNLNSGDQILPLLQADGFKLKTLQADKVVAERNKILPVDRREELTPDTLLGRIEDGGHPLLEARAAFVQADKQLTAYVSPLFDSKGRIRERVYPHFLPTAQDNGRWSTTNPPLAQLPEHLRQLFTPDPGWPWIGWDWSAIELRILAAMARDELLLEGFEKDWDLHTMHCCQLFGYDMPPNMVDPHYTDECQSWRDKYEWLGKDDKRRVFAKTFVYRSIYGGNPRGAGSVPGANKLGLPAGELVSAAHRWLAAHPALEQFWQRLREDALTKGEVRAFSGRRRKLSETDHKRRIRQAYDQPCQAGASDVFNETVIEIKNLFPKVKFVYGMHDSQKWAVPLETLEPNFWGIKETVEKERSIFGVSMKFPADFHVYFAPEDKQYETSYNQFWKDTS